jgi:hypothetical protein
VTENVQSSKLPRSTAEGILKDKVWMPDDFNAPLEELKEYMDWGNNLWLMIPHL